MASITTEYLDDDGYPTDEALDCIREWPIRTPFDCADLLEFAESLWSYPQPVTLGA